MYKEEREFALNISKLLKMDGIQKNKKLTEDIDPEKEKYDNIIEFSDVNERGYVGYQLRDGKNWSSGKLKEDKKGVFFLSKGKKYYIDKVYMSFGGKNESGNYKR